LLVAACALLIGRGVAPIAWAADPTVHYISHRFPMLEFWVKKMGEYPGIKLEAELIPFDQALEKMQIHLSQGASTYDIMATDAFLPTFAQRGWLMRLDPLIAIAVALQILWTGWHLMARSFHGLMDRAIPDEDRAVIIDVLETLRHQGGDYHALRTRVAGAKSFVDVHVLVPGSMSVQAGHDLVERLENEIQSRLPHVEVLTHLEPLEDPKSWDDPGKPLAGT